MTRNGGSRSERFVRLLLGLLPSDFRGDYGRGIEQTFREQRRHAEREEGRMGIWRLWLEFIAGIFQTAPRQHLAMLRQDAAYELRRIRQNPGFAGGVMLTLALGVGANTAIFSVVHGVLLNRLPYSDGDRLAIVRQSTQQPASDDIGFSEKEILDLRAQTRTLDGLV